VPHRAGSGNAPRFPRPSGTVPRRPAGPGTAEGQRPTRRARCTRGAGPGRWPRPDRAGRAQGKSFLPSVQAACAAGTSSSPFFWGQNAPDSQRLALCVLHVDPGRHIPTYPVPDRGGLRRKRLGQAKVGTPVHDATMAARRRRRFSLPPQSPSPPPDTTAQSPLAPLRLDVAQVGGGHGMAHPRLQVNPPRLMRDLAGVFSTMPFGGHSIPSETGSAAWHMEQWNLRTGR
jgi:hypothetical protein